MGVSCIGRVISTAFSKSVSVIKTMKVH